MTTLVTMLHRLPHILVGAGIAMTVGTLALLSSVTNAYGAANGTAYAPCLTGKTGATVHFLTDSSVNGTAPMISGLTISGLPETGCEGSPVTIALRGNTFGDTAIEPTETLSVLNSTLDPCRGNELAHPPVVSHGQITLAACPTGGSAGFANLHDVTQLVLQVRGEPVKVGGTITLPAQGSGSTSVGGGVSSPVSGYPGDIATLPFTGSWAAVTFWLGLGSLVFGCCLLRLDRRRTDRGSEPQ